MRPPQTTVLDGSTFVVSETGGDIVAATEDPQGLFFQDMRHLSRWELQLNGRRLRVLSVDTDGYDEAMFFLIPTTGTIFHNPTMSVARRRRVGDGMVDEVTLTNHSTNEVRVQLGVVFDADFASIFEVKDGRAKKGGIDRQADTHAVLLSYEVEGFRRETRIEATGGEFTEGSVLFTATVAAHHDWRTTVTVSVLASNQRPTPKTRRRPNMECSLEDWLERAPSLDTDCDDLRHAYRRALVDLAALRFYPPGVSGSVPAAGLPWFMALFGRDAMIASYQALPFAPELARTTLLALAARQADDFDDFRDAEPGKILHELRHDDLTYLHQQPQSPYYGAADTTALFLILLDEYQLWTGDTDTALQLQPHALAALDWISDFGDLDGDGYIEYQTRNPTTGLANQCWKDSWNSIVHPDGNLATLPRATCELQGYAYDARIRAARLARDCWRDPELAEQLEVAAAKLKAQFNRDFWHRAGHFYALALDGAKQQVPTLASNMGELLWSGIVSDDHAADVVAHLMGPRLFSGWGVRTLAAGQPAFNPIEYHNGTVWPHDNALIALGLRRYGYAEEAARIAGAFIDACGYFDHRLPETFAGFDRAASKFPVRYPTACSPQAWASGAILAFLRVLLGLQPDGDRLRCAPHLPPGIQAVTLRGIPGRWGVCAVTAKQDQRPPAGDGGAR
jgi:glycogen debranching enzyme